MTSGNRIIPRTRSMGHISGSALLTSRFARSASAPDVVLMCVGVINALCGDARRVQGQHIGHRTTPQGAPNANAIAFDLCTLLSTICAREDRVRPSPCCV